MTEDELQRIFGSVFPRKNPGRQTFRLGDTVRVISGPYASFKGRVEGINQSKALVKVSVEVFGRATALKLGIRDVEKVPFP